MHPEGHPHCLSHHRAASVSLWASSQQGYMADPHYCWTPLHHPQSTCLEITKTQTKRWERKCHQMRVWFSSILDEYSRIFFIKIASFCPYFVEWRELLALPISSTWSRGAEWCVRVLRELGFLFFACKGESSKPKTSLNTWATFVPVHGCALIEGKQVILLIPYCQHSSYYFVAMVMKLMPWVFRKCTINCWNLFSNRHRITNT